MQTLSRLKQLHKRLFTLFARVCMNWNIAEFFHKAGGVFAENSEEIWTKNTCKNFKCLFLKFPDNTRSIITFVFVPRKVHPIKRFYIFARYTKAFITLTRGKLTRVRSVADASFWVLTNWLMLVSYTTITFCCWSCEYAFHFQLRIPESRHSSELLLPHLSL